MCIETLGEQSCASGGELSAQLLVDGAALFADVATHSKLTSPPETISVSFSNTIEGDGPYFILKDCSGVHCELVETGWQVTINATLDDEAFSITSEIEFVYNNGTFLIFSNDARLVNSDTVILSIVASGLASPTPPTIIRTIPIVP